MDTQLISFPILSGLNWAVRKMAVLGNPSCEFSLKDEQITYTVETAMWTDVMTFTVGQEFERVHNKVNLKVYYFNIIYFQFLIE